MAIKGLGENRRPAYHPEWSNKITSEDADYLGAGKPAPALDPYAEHPINREALGEEWTVTDLNGGDTHYRGAGTGPTSDVNEIEGATLDHQDSGAKVSNVKYE